VGGRLLLELGRISDRAVVDQEEDGRSETPSSTNDSPEARKDWPEWCWCVDGDDEDGAAEVDEVADAGVVGDAAEGARKDWTESRKE